MSETNIDNLNELDDVQIGYQGDDYEAPTGFRAPPPAGEYTFTTFEPTTTKRGVVREGKKNAGQAFLGASIRAQVAGGKYDGSKAFFYINSFLKYGGKGSEMDDFVKANKSGKRPTTIKQFEEVLPTLGGPFNAVIGWEWRCKDCDLNFLQGYYKPESPRKYEGPKVDTKGIRLVETTNAKGVKVKVAHHVQVCPGCEQEVGARPSLLRFVVPSGKTATMQVPQNAPVVEGLAPAAG